MTTPKQIKLLTSIAAPNGARGNPGDVLNVSDEGAAKRDGSVTALQAAEMVIRGCAEDFEHEPE